MVLELKFSRNDCHIPWGFRLTGGADYDVPLTVTKVSKGSIAEDVGLEEGDVIVRINNQPMAGLSHVESHDVILFAGQEFVVGVRRDDTADLENESQQNHKGYNNLENDINSQEVSDEERISVKMDIPSTETQQAVTLTTTIDQIEEVIAGGANTTLPGANELGSAINKTNFTESNVLKKIEEETMESAVDDQEIKWSTFLQKPSRPVPVPRKLQELPKAAPYKIVITKQKRKKSGPPVDAPREAIIQPTLQEEHDMTDTLIEEHVDEEDEQYAQVEDIQKESRDEDEDNEKEEESYRQEETEVEKDESDAESTKSDEQDKHRVLDIPSSTPSLEEQLAQVQRQLLQLTQIPSEIQDTLNVVTAQLAKIVRSAQVPLEEEENYELDSPTEDEPTDPTTEEHELSTTEGQEHQYKEDDEQSDSSEYRSEQELHSYEERETELLSDNFATSEQDLQLEIIREQEEEEARRIEEERIEKEQREANDSHQKRLDQRPTMPLTPLERPIILPGGRRWSQPDDACPKIRHPSVTDEKISKMIETYSEVISGRTKGLTNGTTNGHGQTAPKRFTGSVYFSIVSTGEVGTLKARYALVCGFVLGNQEKATGIFTINFLKYQPPPKNLDYLQKSEVFKMLQDADMPEKGIAARPEIIAAEQDYYQRAIS